MHTSLKTTRHTVYTTYNVCLFFQIHIDHESAIKYFVFSPQKCFMLPQSLGVIGGKPNSAHYFIGYVGVSFLQKRSTILAVHVHTWNIPR